MKVTAPWMSSAARKVQRRINQLGSLAAVILLFPANIARADEKPPLIYLAADSVNVQVLLPAPPASDSAQDLADLKAVLGFQAGRGDEDCSVPKYEAHASLSSFFGPKYGPLSQAEVDQWSPLFESVLNDVVYFALQAKDLWPRQRPFTRSSLVHPCLEIAPSNSYPSGHAMIARVYAEVLDLIFPDRKDDIDETARKVGLNRVIAGVHYPSDVEAGERLGTGIVDALVKSEVFLRDLDQVEFHSKPAHTR